MIFAAKTISCPLCGASPERHIVVAERDRWNEPLRTVMCEGCGLVFSNPMPIEAEVARFYKEDYRKLYKGTDRPKRKHIFRAMNAALDRFSMVAGYFDPAGTYLDLGAGGGEFVYLLASRGFRSEGVEPSASYATHAAADYGVVMHVGTFGDIKLPERRYDLVSSFHVFEHLPDPVAAFNHVRAWLKPNGLLYIEVPNVVTDEQTFRSRFHFAHVVHYSPDTLIAMALKAGFALERDLLPANATHVRALFRTGEVPSNLVLPPPRSIARTRDILLARPRFGKHWIGRNVRKFLARCREWLVTRGRSGREVADEVMARRR